MMKMDFEKDITHFFHDRIEKAHLSECSSKYKNSTENLFKMFKKIENILPDNEKHNINRLEELFSESQLEIELLMYKQGFYDALKLFK
ncbi:MAG: hypothetical protein K0S80_1694 [Neobacillus sp.]|nr:hypothetical protein [Neobacillus sp.]